MSSLEYKELLNRFGADVQEINDDLYQATKPKSPADKRESSLRAARNKLDEYDQLLAQLEGARRNQAEQDFAELMAEMRQYVVQLEREE
ncbi:MAG TPA: hypothetical protein VMM12_05935 [Longimicrobiales bacterium]|nr:hypothetical protein [Longimicrobiales bacterium]